MTAENSTYFSLLKNRIDLKQTPFSERGSRLLIFHSDNHLLIRLAERWFKIDKQLSGYRQRPPLIDQLQFTDGEGIPLQLEITTYPHRIDCSTSLGIFTITFSDIETILIALPSQPCGITFNSSMDQGQTDRRGGILRLTGDIRRNVAYTTNARLVINEIEPLNGGKAQKIRVVLAPEPGSVFLLNLTPRLGFNRYLPHADTTLDLAAARWNDWFARAPQVTVQYQPQYYYAWWIMRAGLISTRFYTTREAMTPSLTHYVGVWQWDAFFHALAYRYIEPKLAQDQLRILLDHQRQDGMIPDAVHDEGTITHLTLPVDADVTKPPLIGWAAWKLFQMDGDREFLDEIYEPIMRSNSWWFNQNDLDKNGLCEYQHPFSSGLDDSPLWDDGLPVESPDLNTYLVLQQEALANIATVLGLEKEAKRWRQRASDLVQEIIASRWDPTYGYFWAAHNGSIIKVRTPFNLFPMLTGKVPPKICAQLVAHLTNEKEFWTRFPVPTVAIDDPKYDPNQMWRGPTWVNVNYLLIEGLQKSGYEELAGTLRKKTLDMINGKDDIYEYYNPETGERPPKAASNFGWSAAIYIDLAIQESNKTQT
jgi:hypothetical protein